MYGHGGVSALCLRSGCTDSLDRRYPAPSVPAGNDQLVRATHPLAVVGHAKTQEQHGDPPAFFFGTPDTGINTFRPDGAWTGAVFNRTSFSLEGEESPKPVEIEQDGAKPSRRLKQHKKKPGRVLKHLVSS